MTRNDRSAELLPGGFRAFRGLFAARKNVESQVQGLFNEKENCSKVKLLVQKRKCVNFPMYVIKRQAKTITSHVDLPFNEILISIGKKSVTLSRWSFNKQVER